LADRFCFVICRDNDWTCVSNDKALRRACDSAGVAVLWSLELLLELVKLGHLPADDAWQTAERMHRANPFFLGQSNLAAFREKLDKLEASSGAPRGRPTPLRPASLCRPGWPPRPRGRVAARPEGPPTKAPRLKQSASSVNRFVSRLKHFVSNSGHLA
jgi:hypothetical protein